MKFTEFKEKMESAFNRRFDQSYCRVGIYHCLGTSITIDCLLGKDKTEVISGISQNDMMHVSFIIHMPDSWNDTEDLPTEMTMESISKSIKVKPTNKYLYCESKTIAYRKTKGDAEKQIKTFTKFVDKLFDTVVAEYKADNLLDHDMELIRVKAYAA